MTHHGTKVPRHLRTGADRECWKEESATCDVSGCLYVPCYLSALVFWGTLKYLWLSDRTSLSTLDFTAFMQRPHIDHPPPSTPHACYPFQVSRETQSPLSTRCSSCLMSLIILKIFYHSDSTLTIIK